MRYPASIVVASLVVLAGLGAASCAGDDPQIVSNAGAADAGGVVEEGGGAEAGVDASTDGTRADAAARCVDPVVAPGAAFHFDACEVELTSATTAGNWRDRVGQGVALGTAGYEPNGAGTHPALRFSDHQYVFAHAVGNDVVTGQFALVVVGRYAAGGGFQGGVFAAKVDNQSNPVGPLLAGNYLVDQSTPTQGLGGQLKLGATSAYVNTDLAGPLRVMTLWRNTDNLELRANGVRLAFAALPLADAFDNGAAPWTFGRARSDQNLAGAIAEIILIKAPTEATLTKLEGDLKLRYGL